MGLKTFKIDFQEIASSHYIYASYKFHYYNIEILKSKQLLRCKVSDYFDTFTGYAFKSENYEDEGTKLLRIGDFDKYGDLNISQMACLPEEYYKKFKKFEVKNEDTVIALTGATIGKTTLIEDIQENILLNQRVGIMRLKNRNINPKLFYLLTKSKSFQFQIQIDSMGKGQQNISPTDVSKIKIPLIPKPKQDQIVAEIEPVEKKIRDLKIQIIPQQEVINKVFAREFGFDENLFNEFGKGMTAGTQIAQNRALKVFETNFEELSKSGIVRFSTRFHNTPTKKLMDFLDSIETLQVKDVVESYEKGLQPQYNPDGEIPVVKIANLKNGYIDFSEPELITKEYYKSLDEKKKLKQNDIIICATGKVSLGKIDFYDYEQDSITTVDNYILRLNKDYNTLFFTYFFRSILGYFQIERDYTGATNQIHLYWEQISNFQVPNISLKSQQKIVDEIKAELDKQEEIKKKIQNERNKIDSIIETAINYIYN